MKKIRVVLGLGFSMLFFVIVGCGSSGDSNAVISNATTNTTVKSNVSVVDSSVSKDIVSTQTEVSGAASINIAANSTLGSNLDAGSVISVLPGADNRFPFGLSAKVESVVTNTDGTKQVTLQPATIADVASSSSFTSDPIPLNADNFVGVIAPQATSASITAKIAAKLLPQSGKTALNGGIKVSNGNSGVAKAVQSGTVQGGDVSIALKIKLKDMGIDASRMKPYGINGDAGFEINGSLKNLKLTQDHDFSITSGLKTLDLRATGDVQLETKFTGSGTATLGYYSQAWKEVDDEQVKFLGISGKLSGLSSKDKVGKFPVAGLVWAVPCPPTGCPVVVSTTQTPLRAAKAGGVILWVYLTATGEVTVEGNFGARINPGKFALGVTKTDGGDLDTVHELTNAGSGRFIEVPFIDGKFNMVGRLGTGIDLDFFLSGVRIANASLDVEGRLVEDVDGTISYGTNQLGEPWEWDGNICFSTKIGAGAVFGASLQAGVEVKSAWNKIGGEFAYSGQWPSEEDILLEGWHGIKNKTWYTAASANVCYPKPIIRSAVTTENIVSRIATVTISGANIPDDLSLTVSPSGSCNNIQTGSITGAQAVYTCTISSDSSFTYTLKSNKAQNLDVRSASGLTYQPKTPAIPTCTSPQVLTNGVCATPAPTCASPQMLINGVCVTPTTVCTSPQVLTNGVCVTPPPTTVKTIGNLGASLIYVNSGWGPADTFCKNGGMRLPTYSELLSLIQDSYLSSITEDMWTSTDFMGEYYRINPSTGSYGVCSGGCTARYVCVTGSTSTTPTTPTSGDSCIPTSWYSHMDMQTYVVGGITSATSAPSFIPYVDLTLKLNTSALSGETFDVYIPSGGCPYTTLKTVDVETPVASSYTNTIEPFAAGSKILVITNTGKWSLQTIN